MFSSLIDKVKDAVDGDSSDEEKETSRDIQLGGGRKRALLVGINYIGHSQGVLNGCINDTKNVKKYLQDQWGYEESNIRLLNDDDPAAMPTKANIVAGMNWLVSDASPGDTLFFHYSGHGSQQQCEGTLSKICEGDGKEETLCPSDYDTQGMITDNEIFKMIVKPLPEGVLLSVIIDACHSGTMLDLAYLYEAPEAEYKDAHESDEGFFSRAMDKIDITSIMSRGIPALQQQAISVVSGEVLHHGSKYVSKSARSMLGTSKAHVVMFSGCRDEQTSADATIEGEATGAMSYALLNAMAAGKHDLNYTTLIRDMRDILHKGPKKYSQMPQMSFGRETDPDRKVQF